MPTGYMPVPDGGVKSVILGREITDHALVGTPVTAGTYREPSSDADLPLHGIVVAVHAVDGADPGHRAAYVCVLAGDHYEYTVPVQQVTADTDPVSGRTNARLVNQLRKLYAEHTELVLAGDRTRERLSEVAAAELARELSFRGLGDIVNAVADVRLVNDLEAAKAADVHHAGLRHVAERRIAHVLAEVGGDVRPEVGADEPVRLATIPTGIDQPRATVRVLRWTNAGDNRVVVEFRESRRGVTDYGGVTFGFRVGELRIVNRHQLILAAGGGTSLRASA